MFVVCCVGSNLCDGLIVYTVYTFGPIDNITQILYYHKKGPLLNTIECFYFHKERATDNQLNDKQTIYCNKIFDAILNIVI